MKLVLLGPPGVGKGTQAQLLSKWLKVPVISTGDMLRAAVAAGTELGRAAQQYMHSGQLVPDQMMVGLVKVRIEAADCQAGFILDGFPRTAQQAIALNELDVEIECVLALELSDAVIVKRLSGRWVHPASGRVYHTAHHPPQRDLLDDVTGEPLVQREDDRAETVRARLEVYHRQTEPLLSYYSTAINGPLYHQVSARGDAEEVHVQLKALLRA